LQVLYHDIAIRELALEKLRGLDGDLSAFSVRARLAVDGNFELRSLRYPRRSSSASRLTAGAAGKISAIWSNGAA
jgi:hypothetical protein